MLIIVGDTEVILLTRPVGHYFTSIDIIIGEAFSFCIENRNILQVSASLSPMLRTYFCKGQR